MSGKSGRGMRIALQQANSLKCFNSLRFLFIAIVIFPSISFSMDQEIPLNALLGNKKAFLDWRAPFKKWYFNQIDSVIGFTPLAHKVLSKEIVDDVSLVKIQFEYAPGTPLFGKVGGGC